MEKMSRRQFELAMASKNEPVICFLHILDLNKKDIHCLRRDLRNGFDLTKQPLPGKFDLCRIASPASFSRRQLTAVDRRDNLLHAINWKSDPLSELFTQQWKRCEISFLVTV
jgi:hypothetical protein